MNRPVESPKILVASRNPIKANAIELAFADMFGVTPIIEKRSLPSGVSDQPLSDAETLAGALNRVNAAVASGADFDYFAGIEGGIEETDWGMEAFAWIVIRSDRLIGKARSATFPLPPEIARLVREGTELGDADDIVFGVKNSKQDGGAVGLLTDGTIDRVSLYRHAACLALIPFKNQRLFITNEP